jgi:glycosyltransferase involved in cell wall biosynthesis
LLKIQGKKLVITYHSFRDDVERFNWFKKKAAQINLRLASRYIAVNHHIKRKLISLGANPSKVTVLPAFLPPVIKQGHIDNIPNGIRDFINRHTPIVSASAFRISFYDDIDLYGIDMCIALCTTLKSSYPDIGLVFCLSEIEDFDYFSKMKIRIAEEGIEDNIYFNTEAYHFYPIIMKSDVFVRPTNTDGDAVSLREALYFKVPSIASDVVLRPEGTVLFKNRDVDDLILKMRDILGKYDWYQKKLEVLKTEDNFEKIMEIYQT